MPIPIKTGETLRGRYRVRKIIGQGGMGCIYLCDDLRLEGRQCALKEVEHDKTLPDNLIKEARSQFQREATILARLDHPNLPKVSDFFSINQRDYLVMDFIPGKDLRTTMVEARDKNQFLSENDILNWANQLSDALGYLHGQNPAVLHRDIKPSNIKITPNGVIKLVDFGLVKVLAPGEVTITILQGQGTALYTPLEQYGGDIGHTDARSDIFSLASTLYHLLTNKAPIDARQRFLDPNVLVPIKQVNSSISLRTEKAIQWGMNLHPDDRPQNIEDFRDALIGSRPIHIPPGVQGSYTRKNRSLKSIEIITFLILAATSILSLILTIVK